MSNSPFPVSITPGPHKDVQGLVFESEALHAIILPQFGGKMASLVHKATGHEHLDQVPGEQFRRAPYGAPYDSGEPSGFDEMFPTITECFCDVAPWAGTQLPDHGEVWSLPWQCEQTDRELRLSVHGVRLPYVLRKTVRFDRPDSILLKYRVENPSACDLPAMWAAHPLFRATPGMRIILPEAVRHIMNTVPGPALGGYGERHGFPRVTGADGREYDLSRVGPNEGKHYFKYFVLDPLDEGFAILHDPSTRETVGLAWPVEQVPYLGMWVTEGAWMGRYHVAPEPCTAPFDRWDVARQWGRLPMIPALGSREWSLRITVGLTDNPRRVDQDGTIR
jgi:hypothetical protein